MTASGLSQFRLTVTNPPSLAFDLSALNFMDVLLID